jgi:hypothetical protein
VPFGSAAILPSPRFVVTANSAFADATAATVAVGVVAGAAGALLQPAITIDAAAKNPMIPNLMRVFLRAIQRAVARVRQTYPDERRRR